MLVLKRKEGQWVEVTHRSGDVLRIRVCRIEGGSPDWPGCLNLAFDDADRHFEIERPERRYKEVTGMAVPGGPRAVAAGTDAGRPTGVPKPVAPAAAFGPAPDEEPIGWRHLPGAGTVSGIVGENIA